MTEQPQKMPVAAEEVPARQQLSNYPAAILAQVAPQLMGRKKRALGNHFGLGNFGVNLTRLAPGAVSALLHGHMRQDEFIYVLEGRPTLYTSDGTMPMAPGMCAGFKAGSGLAHRLLNETDEDVVYLEIGDRTSNDEVSYPDHDLLARSRDGAWVFFHKDGRPY
jgi:uncharacterized cupin superfamily protein